MPFPGRGPSRAPLFWVWALLAIGCAGKAHQSESNCLGGCSGGGGAGAMVGGTGGGGTGSGGTGAGGKGGDTEQGTGGVQLSEPEICDVDSPADDKQFALWPMPTPPELGLSHPASYVMDDDTLLDEVTGLMWQRGHSSSLLTVPEGFDYCASLELGSHCNWRVPSRVEMASLIDATYGAEVQSLFDEPEARYPAIDGSGQWWGLSLEGSVTPRTVDEATDTIGLVRCVRVHRPAPAAPRNLSLQGEGDDTIVFDSGTGLEWKHESPIVELPLAQAAPHCASIGAAGAGFRLASVKELMTLVDPKYSSTHNLDPSLFPLSGARTNQIAWASPELGGDDSWLVGFTSQMSYLLSTQVTVVPDEDRLVFCVR